MPTASTGPSLCKALPARIEYTRQWFQPGKKAALFNDTHHVLTVHTYDHHDFRRWVPYGRFTIAPRKPGVIEARGNMTFRADSRGKVYNVRIGSQHVFNSATVIGR